MKSPIPDYLIRELENVRPIDSGNTAQYIDVLARADTSRLGVAIATVDGNVYSAGDDLVEFSIQSISKIFVYALAIQDATLEKVLEKIGVEPTGNAFNELSLHKGSNRPMNPMINAGAITAHSLVCGPNATAEQRTARILKVMSTLAGRELKVDEEVYEAELKDGDRNIGLAHMLKAAGIISGCPREMVKGYFRQCSINVTVRDLAMMASTLSNAGYQPVTGEKIFPRDTVRQVLSIMATCGMYDAAGDWISSVGIPAKSGVGGGILGALPGQVGLATFSPKLDDKGNSVRGVALCKTMSHDMGLHMMDVSQIARSTVTTTIATLKTADDRHPKNKRRIAIFHMRGAVRFSGSEVLTRALTRALGEKDPKVKGSGEFADACAVVLSFREVFSLSTPARRIVHEDIRRLLAEDRIVVVIDPTGVLKWDAEGRERHPEVVEDQDQARVLIGGAGCSATVEENW